MMMMMMLRIRCTHDQVILGDCDDDSNNDNDIRLDSGMMARAMAKADYDSNSSVLCRTSILRPLQRPQHLSKLKTMGYRGLLEEQLPTNIKRLVVQDRKMHINLRVRDPASRHILAAGTLNSGLRSMQAASLCSANSWSTWAACGPVRK